MPTSRVEQILDLARALYQRGAIPEALAIAREVFVSLGVSDDLAELLPGWIRSLGPGRAAPPPPGTGAAIGSAIELLEPVLDEPGGIRALTNLCTIRPITGAPLAEHTIRALSDHEYEVTQPWLGFPAVFSSPAIGWEVASPVLAAARRQGLAVPDDFTTRILKGLPNRTRERLSPEDTGLVNAFALGLRDRGNAEPALRLAVAAAVTSAAPLPMALLMEIVGPGPHIRRAVDLFDRRGYPTEAVNMLVDCVSPLSGSSDTWQQLWRLVQQRLTGSPEAKVIGLGQRSKPPSPGPGGRRRGSGKERLEPQPVKSFYFILDGEQAGGDQVVRGQPVDLYFEYDLLPDDALARLEGKSLEKAADRARKGKPVEIGVFIKPVGFAFRDDDEEYKIAEIENDAMKMEVCFELKAPQQPAEDTGFHAVLTYNGSEVFQGFIRIAVVDAIDRSAPSVTQLALSRSAFDGNEALPRDITAFITRDQDGQCRVSVRVGSELPKKPRALELLQLQNAISAARTTLAEVADTAAFRSMTPGRWGPEPGQESEFLGALCRTMSAGSTLHKFLRDSEATSDLAAAIEALPSGGKVSIFTDSAFVPWEIVFPRHFFCADPTRETAPEGYAPELMWGNRFEFETVLVFDNRSQNVQHVLPPVRRQPGSLNIRMGVGAVEPDPEPGTPPAEAALNAVAHHRAYCNQHPSIAHWLQGSEELKKAFSDPGYDVSLLYLVCHGRSSGSSEELDFGGYKPIPDWLNYETAYPGWPVVFINSCSIGAISPHVFDTFLRRFREKHAFGLVASSFPLPTRFATLFGCEFLEGYRRGTRIGELLLKLRQQLLKETNPLGFFYALQSPLDVQRPEQPKEP